MSVFMPASSVDPWRPFVPAAATPWDRAAATHLLRRAGFAANEGEVRAALVDPGGPAGVVSRHLDLTEDHESARFRELDLIGESIARGGDLGALQAWWLLRMLHTARPLHGRLGVFWHNHFATSNVKVASPVLMLQQLRTIERHALGPLRELLRAIARDPAMIIWLDGDDNINGRPNENFARELFELFTLGVGQYTERDIKEAARAFTGWGQRNGRFVYRDSRHDDDHKEVLGVEGRLQGDDVIDAALAQPACARFIARKMLVEFLTPHPPEPLVEAYAVVLRSNEYHIGASLRALLTSQTMFEPEFRRVRIASPVEFAVGLVRSLELHEITGPELASAVATMGQPLFEPPSVKGWEGHRAWLNTATMLARLNAARDACEPTRLQADRLCRKYDVDSAAEARRLALDLMLDGVSPPGAAKVLDDAVLPTAPDAALRLALRTLARTPEYQLR